MEFLDIILTLSTSTILLIWAGYLLVRSARSPALIFMVLLMIVAAIANTLMPLLATAEEMNAQIYVRTGSLFFMLTLVTLLFLVLVFPYNYALIASANRKRAFFLAYLITAGIVGSLYFLIAEAAPFQSDFWFNENTLILIYTAVLVVMPLSLILDFYIYRSTAYSRNTAIYFSVSIGIFLLSCIISVLLGDGPYNWVIINFGIFAGIGVIAYLFMTHRVQSVKPVQEALSVGSKSMYKLLSGRIYVVEEERPRFAFELFGEILRRRCFDCKNDESFACESLDCRLCSLPCPCRECNQHMTRTQGLVITRRHPGEVRMEYMIQTTPIIWLTSLPGRDNIDPSKLSLLTDMIVNFIEKSQNGVVIVEGIEYLITANDFNRVIRAIDRWSEIVMSNSSRLVMSVNPKAFDQRELALLERNREVIKLTDKASIERILASSYSG